MESKILDGKGLAQIAEQEIKSKVSKLKDKGITPTLATVLVGVDPASATYVKMKQNACSRLGMESIAIELGKDTTTDELLKTIFPDFLICLEENMIFKEGAKITLEENI